MTSRTPTHTPLPQLQQVQLQKIAHPQAHPQPTATIYHSSQLLFWDRLESWDPTPHPTIPVIVINLVVSIASINEHKHDDLDNFT